jgi:hypothetical protein
MKPEIVLLKTFGHRYFYTNQHEIIKTLAAGETDIFCCAPRYSGIRTAVISQVISSGVKCIFIIRSIAEIEAMHKLLSFVCKLKVLTVTSSLAVSERLSVFKTFLSDDTLFLITTPDQFRSLKDHSSLVQNCPTQLLITIFDCERTLPESFHHHASYSDSLKLIHSIQSTLGSASQTQSKLTTLLVSECLSHEQFKAFQHPLRPPAKFIHAQHQFGNTQILCCNVSTGSLGSVLSEHISDESQSVAIIYYKPTNGDFSVTLALESLRRTTKMRVFDQSQLSEANAFNKPFIFITSSLHYASQANCQKIVHIGIPENTSHLTFLLSNTKNLVELHFLYTQKDINMLSTSVSLRYPSAFCLTELIDYLCEQPISAIVTQQQLMELGSTANVDPLAIYRFIDWMLELGYLKKIKVESVSKQRVSHKVKICSFQILLLPNKDFLVNLVAKRHARAQKRASDTLGFMFSSKCKQVAFNELNGDPKLALSCGHCIICKPALIHHQISPSKKVPPTESEIELMRFKLITLRNSSAINGSLPASLLLPDAAIEQVLEKWPTSIDELKKLDSFKNNSRHHLFGEAIIDMLTSSQGKGK